MSWIESVLGRETGVFVAVSDYMKAHADVLRGRIPGPFTALGTDGYGLSEARPEIRDHFEISPPFIALAALDLLRKEGRLTAAQIDEFIRAHGILPEKPNPAGNL